MGIVEGVLEVALGLWLIGRFRRKSPQTKVAERQRITDAQLKARKAALDLYAEALKQRHQSLDVLDKMTAEDAIKREQRAKAALRAVLIKGGCSEDAIDSVMADVDGTEDGDLKT